MLNWQRSSKVQSELLQAYAHHGMRTAKWPDASSAGARAADGWDEISAPLTSWRGFLRHVGNRGLLVLRRQTRRFVQPMPVPMDHNRAQIAHEV
jgi:hypothetical protein